MGRLGVIALAWHIDGWLKEHLGRPYNVVLSVGLALSLSATFVSLQKTASSRNILELVGLTAFQVLLLINQLAQLHERRQARRERRTARQEARWARPAERTSTRPPAPGDGGP